MANYECTTRTNYFRVTDEERYKELFGLLTAEMEIEDFTKEDGEKILHGFGSYCDIDCYGDEEQENLPADFDEWLEELQKILPEDEAFIYMQAGNEKLRYVIPTISPAIGSSSSICRMSW